MAYIAKLKRGSDYIVTSSSETVQGCLEALVSFISSEEGENTSISVENVEVEYTDVPYVFSSQRNWKGELVKIYGFTIERAKEIMEKGGYGSLHLAYSKAFDPKTSIEEKERIFGFKGKDKKAKHRQGEGGDKYDEAVPSPLKGLGEREGTPG